MATLYVHAIPLEHGVRRSRPRGFAAKVVDATAPGDGIGRRLAAAAEAWAAGRGL